MNSLIQLKRVTPVFLIGMALACFAFPSLGGEDRPPPRGEDRGNGNSAAEDVDALNLDTAGSNNTAHGWFSLFSDAMGRDNTADGFQALYSNLDGVSNTADGSQALLSNTAGSFNTAVGRLALSNNTEGNFNSGVGQFALFNTMGGANTGVGYGALFSNTTGRNNTALGYFAGFNVADALNVICIGYNVVGANVSNTTWIGNVYGVTTQNTTTAPVIVSANGQLGTVASSERFKKDIATMDKASELILSLRPVTFHYKSDAKGTPQFGLIAEEVAKVNPALVLPDKEGKPYTVRYDAINAMLLNEFLKEHRLVQEQGAMIARQQKQIEAVTTAVQKVSAQLELSQSTPQTVLNNR
jgi:Chaperone of endosialidase